jgi:amino acid adenylation domain-containing protein
MTVDDNLSQLSLEAFRARRRNVDAIPRLPRDGTPLPLSLSQQRLWLMMRIPGADDAYRIALRLRLPPTLRVDALRAALDGLVARHEALRVRLRAGDDRPHADLLPADCGCPLRVLDAVHDAQAHDVQAPDALLRDDAVEAFDLVRALPLRALLARTGEGWVFALTLHHLVADGWSMDVLIRELGALYAAACVDGDAALPSLPVQYADYAAWQRQRLQSARALADVEAWEAALRGAPALLALPTDRRRPPRQAFHGALLQHALDADLTAQLRSAAQRLECTPFMLLLAAWSLVLSRVSGQDDVVIGSPVANRGRSELGGMIGFFANTLALRLRLDDAPDGHALIAHARSVVLEAQGRSETPFEQVVERLNPPRSLGHTPVFQVLLAWEGERRTRLQIGDLQADVLPPLHTTAKFDLSLFASECDGRIEMVAEYATALFDADSIRRHLAMLECALRGLLATPQRPLAQLPLLPADDAQRLLHDWAQGPALPLSVDGPQPQARPMPQVFEAHAAAHPDALALTCASAQGEGVELTYGELNARANRLARHLRAQGVGPEIRVALCVQRSHFGIEAVLAVMKAGGAYVPVDPSYPQERIAEMLADARPALVLTDTASRAATEAALASEGLSVSVIDVIVERDAWSAQSAADLPAGETGVTLDTLAYVIYTSGSTGKPKGVMMPHRGPATLMQALHEPFGLDAQTRVLQFASFSFDAFVLEWVMAFGWGGSLHLGTPGELLLGDALEALVARRGVTHSFLTPTLLMSLPESVQLASLHTLACGGEAVPPQTVKRWAPGRRFINAYGPTETTALSIVGAFQPQIDAEDEALPIGRPLAGERVYILDPHLHPVPPGVSGELYIGGAGVARGYLDRVELTAERFIDSPFVRGDRLYKTGDVARWRNDGRIEYLGRNDFQVKLRGYRIELGEIETRLMAQPGVKEAVVLAREDVPGQKQLVAYVLAESDASEDQLAATTLRAALLPQLPEYMVPAVYLPVDAWPLTGNGKLDRKALPAPDADALASDDRYVAPDSDEEKILAALCAWLLRRPRVGAQDHFFRIGGHSLLAMRLIAAVREVVGVELPLTAVFEAPTIADLALRLATAPAPD